MNWYKSYDKETINFVYDLDNSIRTIEKISKIHDYL